MSTTATFAANQAPAITSANNTAFTVGTVGSFTVTATGVPTPTLSESGTLPGGVTFVDNHNGTGTLSGTPTSAGTYNITFSASNGQGTANQAFTLTVSKGNTTTTVASSSNPSVFGQSVTFTATVSPSSAAGTMQFAIDGSNFGSPVTVSGGSATSGPTSSLSVGNRTITAAFTDTDNNYNNSTSGNFAQTVNQASTTTAVSSSLNPSVFGQSVTLTATVSVTAPGSGTGTAPTGTVTFKDSGTTVGTGALAVVGGQFQATLTTTALTVGTHNQISAVYGGDTNFKTSTSANFIQTVNKASTSTAVTSSPTHQFPVSR